MEKHTCNTVRMTFHCVQPISLKVGIYETLITESTRKKQTDAAWKEKPEWLSQFLQFSSAYGGIEAIESATYDIDLFKQDVAEHMEYAKDFFDYEHVRSYLLWNESLKIFTSTFEIPVTFDVKTVGDLNFLHNKTANIYNDLRDIIVSHIDIGHTGKWVTNTKLVYSETLRKFIKKLYPKVAVNKGDIFVKHDSINISNMVHLENSHLESEIKKKLFKMNTQSERVAYHNQNIINDCVEYNFNGRFHTIFINQAKHLNRYMPIQFHMQYLYQIGSFYGHVLDDINNRLSGTRTTDYLFTVMENMIFKIAQIKILDEKFKQGIEGDNDCIYSKVAPLWNIQGLIGGLDIYTEAFREYLARINTGKSNRSARKQNNILFFISMLQLVALLSVWTDYLSLASEDFQQLHPCLIRVFGNAQTLTQFNILLPIALSFIAIGVTATSLVQRKKRFSVR